MTAPHSGHTLTHIHTLNLYGILRNKIVESSYCTLPKILLILSSYFEIHKIMNVRSEIFINKRLLLTTITFSSLS
jgi:hypothetical protein